MLCSDVRFKQDPSAGKIAKVIDELERKIRLREPSVGQIFIEINSLKECGLAAARQ